MNSTNSRKKTCPKPWSPGNLSYPRGSTRVSNNIPPSTMGWKKDPLSFDCSCLAVAFIRFPARNRSNVWWTLFGRTKSLPSSLVRLLSSGNPRYRMGFFDKILFIDWKEESDPLVEDFAVVPLLALFFPTFRFFMDRFVFEKLAKRCILGRGHYKLDVDIEERRKLNKFKESAWKFIYFLSAEILALSVTYDEPWFRNTKCFWVGPGDQVWPDQKTKLKLKGLYMYAAGFYTYSIFALIFWETRRSDFGVSMGHHVATLILIVLSYILRFSRAGSIVLALHDASDVFLETGKMSKYSGYEWFASFSFIIFVASWMILRLTYYPFWILRSTSYEVLLDLDKGKHKVDGPIYYYLFNTLLCCLLVLHIYWWVLMCRMLANQIKARGQLGDDVRSDSESEDEHAD